METACQNMPLPPDSKWANPTASQPVKPRRYNGVNAKLEGAFFNATDSHIQIKHEQPWHRVAAEMRAAGHTIVEIARVVNKDPQYVSDILTQPYSQRNMIESIQRNVADELKTLIEAEASGAFFRMVELAKEAKSETVKLAANDKILDRFMGKPNQPISTPSVEPSKLTNEELAQQVQRIVTSRGGSVDGVAETPGSTA